jgi:hypothetical protein
LSLTRFLIKQARKQVTSTVLNFEGLKVTFLRKCLFSVSFEEVSITYM